MRSIAWHGDWPITQYFGLHPEWYERFGLAGHNGLDVGLPNGTEIRSPIDGAISEIAYDERGYGLYIAVVNPDETEKWLLAHLSSRWSTKVGDYVVRGTPIASSGSSGNSTGPHLHIAYRPWNALRGWPWNGYVDPLPFLLRDAALHGNT